MAVTTSVTDLTDVLRPFLLEGVRDTDKTIGDGSYATVKELYFRGLKCAGKKLHNIVYNLASPEEKTAMLQRFASECQLLSRLHHPCIVQFLGVYFEQGSQLPVMVMEYLHTNLSSCLDKGILPEEISYQVLLDVILGLRYLHENVPPIIHRDLSANNVLLTPHMNAKISDLGVAKILNLNPLRMGQMTQTQMPGTPAYMPPEAMVARPKYTTKVDIFSFGVMMVHVLSGQWPIPGEAFREDPDNPNSNIPLSEFDRRVEYLRDVPLDHPLMKLIRQSLNNVPLHRPDAATIHQHLETVFAKFPSTFLNRSEMLQRISSQNAKVDALTRQVEMLRTKVDKFSSGDRDEVEMVEETQHQEPLLLNPQSKLVWRECADMLQPMAYPHLVRINNDVYVGGGNSKRNAETISIYSPAGNKWSTLPKCPTYNFGLTELDGKPVIVGGIKKGTVCIRDVYILESSQNWKSLTPLSTARFFPTVFRYKSFVVACGGVTSFTGPQSFTCTTSVEIFSSVTSQWYKAEDIPLALSAMSYAIIDDVCYLIGGTNAGVLSNRVFSASLSSLVERALPPTNTQSLTASRSSSLPPPAIWRELPSCPYYAATAAGLGSNLLAIGGKPPGDVSVGTTLVHVYSPSTNLWVQASNADLPVPRYRASATQLDSGNVILMGGRIGRNEFCNTVFVGSIVV